MLLQNRAEEERSQARAPQPQDGISGKCLVFAGFRWVSMFVKERSTTLPSYYRSCVNDLANFFFLLTGFIFLEQF